METIRVNMTPCEDVQTIHASQNDNEAREWGFELHNNGEKIDSSSISDQMVFKAYKGGTEQILPENGSTPTTSPFKGDIRYPQGLLSDQEFLYRESPTEEDGLAFIDNIKGNTLVWNQLVQNGNFADTSLWRTYSSTGFSVSNNVGSFTVTGSTGAIYQTNTPTYVSGHKYLVIADFYVSQQSNISVEVSGTRGRAVSVNANTWYRYSDIVAPSAQGNFSLTCGQASVQVRNVMCFDLTQMGLDITDPSEFTSLFPLPYYAYNQGSLLSFNGNGIKTVGFNQWDEQWEIGGISVTTGGNEIRNNSIRSKNFIPIFADSTYYFKLPSATYPFFYDENKNYIGFHGSGNTIYNRTFVPSALTNSASGGGSFANAKYMKFRCDNGGTYEDNICLNFSSDKNGTYEPYTESAISIPLDEFPNGMDGVNDVRYYKNETGYVKRIGQITFDGTHTIESIATFGSYTRFTINHGQSNVKYPNAQQISNYIPYLVSFTNESTHFYMNGKQAVVVMLTSVVGSTRDSFNAYLSAHHLTILYELVTPLENYGVVDLGTLNWVYSNSVGAFTSSDISSIVKKPSSNASIFNGITSKYITVSTNNSYSINKSISVNIAGSVFVKDTSYSTAEAFKSAMSGVYLLYEKENPQGFTTASLVTENTEIPLSNEDGVLIGKCTEQLSSESGFFDAKIKLADEDGECYSNKIQLHIERSPQ